MKTTSAALRRFQDQQIPRRTDHADDNIDARIAILASILADRELEPDPVVRSSGSGTDVPKRTPMWRVGTLAVVATAAVLSVVLVVLTGRSAATAQTPPSLTFQPSTDGRSATLVLNSLASIAAKQPQLTPGPFLFSSMRGWYLNTSQTLDGPATNDGIIETTREAWRSSSGAIRLVQTSGSEQTESRLDQPIETGLENLPSAPAQLRSVLRRHSPDYGPGSLVGAVADAWSADPALSPNVNAGLLRVLADEAGLTVLGTVTDRAGRPGIAISANVSNGYTEQRILVVDPSTGRLLSYETVFLSGDELPVEAPATTGYTLWLERAYVSSDTAKP